jgi:hypothetical protein
MTIHIHLQHFDTLPGDQDNVPVPTPTPADYIDSQGRDWQYWPTAAADQMWREVTCNQFNCFRPAAFVGLADVLGDGTLYFDSASAWCYWCMHREAMTPESERMARHAEWARRQTVEDCIALIRNTRDQAGETDTVDAALTRLMSDLRSSTESREEVLSYSILPPEYLDGRPHTPEQLYAVRPVGNSAAVPEDERALELRNGNYLSANK